MSPLYSVTTANTYSYESKTLETQTQFKLFYTTDLSPGSIPNTEYNQIISVGVDPLPNIANVTFTTNTICQNSNTTFSNSVSGGVWSSDDLSVATVNSLGVVTGVAEGNAFINYRTTDPVTGCVSDRGELIYVNPTPMISSYNDAVCSGRLYSVTPSGFVPSGTTFNWPLPTSNAPNGELTTLAASATSTQTTVNALLTNSSSSVYVATYSITATKGSCISAPFILNLSVTPKPVITNRIVQACSGSRFTDAPTNGNGNIVPVGITYSWSAPSPINNLNGLSSGTNQSDFNGTLTNSTSDVITAVYTVSTYNSGCPGTTFTATVNVNPTPVITVNPISSCSNSSFTVPINNGGGNIVPVSTTYTWSAPSVSGITGLQSGTNTSTITGILSNTTSATITNINYSITPTSGSLATRFCTGSPFTLNVTVYPVPIMSALGPTQTGSGSAFNFTFGKSGDIVPIGTTYFWGVPSVPNGITGGVASGTSTETSLTGTLFNPTGTYLDAIYTIIPSYENCQGSSFTYTVRVYPKPIIGPKSATICSGQSFGPIVLTDGVNGDVIPGGTTYSWSAPIYAGITGTVSATAASTISGTLNNTTNYAITVTYLVTPLASPQAGDQFNVSITVNPLPIASIAITENSGLNSNDNIICNDINANFAAIPAVGSTADYNYSWTLPAGATAPGNTASFNSKISGSYILNSLTNINTGCVSAAQTSTSLVVNPIPSVGPVIGPNNVCVNNSITLQTSLLQGGSGVYSLYYWYDGGVLLHAPFSTNTFNVIGRNAGEGNITYKVQDDNGCLSEASTPVFLLNVNALPLAPIANSINQPYNGLLQTGAATPINPSTEQIDWYLNSSDNTTSVAPSATNVGPTVTSYAISRNATTGCISENRTPVTVTITQKSLKVIANDFTKEYNRVAYSGGNGVVFDGFVNGETERLLTGSLSYTGTAQNAINAGTYSITPSGLSSNNYAITMVSGQLKITPKGLTITGANVLNKIYDATDNATMNAGSLVGLIAADVANVVLNYSAKFPNKNVGNNLPITSTSTISGSAASNYTLDPTINVTASITRKQIEAIGVVTADKVYDGTTTASVTGGGFNAAIDPGTGSSSDKTPYKNDVIQIVPSGTFADKNVANNIAISSTSTISGTDANNYTLIQPTLVARNITPKALTMSGLFIASPKVYNGNTVAIVQGTPALLTSEQAGTGSVNDGAPYTNDLVSIAGTPIGTYNSKDVLTANAVSFSGLSLSGANANNYTLTIQSPYTSSILKKALNMFGLSVPSTKVYDGNTSATVGGIPNLYNAVSSNSATDTDGFPIIGDEVSIAGTPVGTYNSKDVISATFVAYSGLSLSGNQASNYALNTQTNSAATIVPLSINVKADAQTKVYGEADPYFTYVSDPLIGSDTFMGALDRQAGENFGEYQINQGTLLLDPNYTIVYTPNKLKILQAELIIQPKPVERTYGDEPLQTVYSSTDFTTTGLMNDETISSVTISLPSGVGYGNSKKDSAGRYIGIVNASNPIPGNIDLNNYKLKFLPGDLIVKKYGITIYAEPKEKRKTQLDPPFTYTVSRPLVEGDSLVGSLTREPGEEVGLYKILQGTVYINDNYAIKYIASDLEILTIERVIVVPNAFTPNNDGLNDVLKIIHNSTITSINYYKIFDRSGKQIFETRNIKEGWDGKLNGAVAESDAYYWMVEYNTWDNKVFQVKGSFVLIK